MHIDLAGSNDLLEVAKMYRDMTRVYYPFRKISTLKRFVLVCKAWINSPLHYVFITKRKNEITGLIILYQDDNHGLTEFALNVTGTYIKPKYRNGKTIKELMEMASIMADGMEMNLCSSSTLKSASLGKKIGGIAQAIELERPYHG